MPLWDYRCPSCKEQKNDLLRKYADIVVCKCGEEMKKLVNVTPAWMFKQPQGTDKGRLMQVAKWKDKRLKNK